MLLIFVKRRSSSTVFVVASTKINLKERFSINIGGAWGYMEQRIYRGMKKGCRGNNSHQLQQST